jgi:hypothetical protein
MAEISVVLSVGHGIILGGCRICVRISNWLWAAWEKALKAWHYSPNVCYLCQQSKYCKYAAISTTVDEEQSSSKVTRYLTPILCIVYPVCHSKLSLFSDLYSVSVIVQRLFDFIIV